MQREPWVQETHFGNWFQATPIWADYVLGPALEDLYQLLVDSSELPQRVSHILDAGCGGGAAFLLTEKLFQPDRVTAVDIDPQMVAEARIAAAGVGCEVEVWEENVERLSLPDFTFDLVLCHQTLHHVNSQESVLQEFYRVLKPGGLLLLAESCQRFIHSLLVRLLFRHPNENQRTVDEYIELVRDAGFELCPTRISNSYPFWSRPDFGLIERLGGRVPEAREPTQVNLIARRPLGSA